MSTPASFPAYLVSSTPAGVSAAFTTLDRRRPRSRRRDRAGAIRQHQLQGRARRHRQGQDHPPLSLRGRHRRERCRGVVQRPAFQAGRQRDRAQPRLRRVAPWRLRGARARARRLGEPPAARNERAGSHHAGRGRLHRRAGHRPDGAERPGPVQGQGAGERRHRRRGQRQHRPAGAARLPRGGRHRQAGRGRLPAHAGRQRGDRQRRPARRHQAAGARAVARRGRFAGRRAAGGA